MKNITRVIKNQDGLSLIPVLLVSMILVSLLSVWMIQFSNNANVQSADWAQKENFRIGTELAKQIGAGYDLYKQQGGGCATNQVQSGTFCFPRAPDTQGGQSGTSMNVRPTGACANSAMVGNGSGQVCLKVISRDKLKEKFPGLEDSDKITTFYAEYQSHPRLNLFMSTANATPQGAPSIPVGFSPNVATAVTTCTGIDTPYGSPAHLCHACGVGGNITCYQVIYCSVADPNCTNLPPLKLGVMVNTN